MSSTTFCCWGELTGLPLLSQRRYALRSIRSLGIGGWDVLESVLGILIWKFPWFNFNLEKIRTRNFI